MSFTHTLGFTWRNGGPNQQSKAVNNTGDGEDNRDFVAANGTTTQVNLAFDKDYLLSIFIFSDKAITLKTNDSGSPANTIPIAANNPYIWYTGCGYANPFTTDVTNTYWTNAGEEDANIFVGVLVNSTP